MKSNLTMSINKSELLKMLSAYYTEIKGHEISVKANVNQELKGYGMGEYMDTEVEIQYVEEIEVGKIKAKITTRLSEDDIKEALNNILEKLSYQVDEVTYDKGVKSIGYYQDEHDEAYFNGVTLNIRQKGMEKVLK